MELANDADVGGTTRSAAARSGIHVEHESALWGAEEFDKDSIANMPFGPGGESHRAGVFLDHDDGGRSAHYAASLSNWRSHSSERFSLKVISPLRLRTERRAAASSCSRSGCSRCTLTWTRFASAIFRPKQGFVTGMYA